MTPLQEHLYQYIMEDRFTALLADEAYQAVRQQVSDAEAQLLAAPPEEAFASGVLDLAFGVQVRRVETPTGWQYYCE